MNAITKIRIRTLDLEHLVVFNPRPWQELNEMTGFSHIAESALTQTTLAIHYKDYTKQTSVHYKGQPVYYHNALLQQWQ